MHGSGYELNLRFAPPAHSFSVEEQEQYMSERVEVFKQILQPFCVNAANGEKSVLRDPDVNGLNAVFIVDVPTNGVSTMMRQLEIKCAQEQVQDWTIAQVTLERVFNKFAAESENAGMDEET